MARIRLASLDEDSSCEVTGLPMEKRSIARRSSSNRKIAISSYSAARSITEPLATDLHHKGSGGGVDGESAPVPPLDPRTSSRCPIDALPWHILRHVLEIVESLETVESNGSSCLFPTALSPPCRASSSLSAQPSRPPSLSPSLQLIRPPSLSLSAQPAACETSASAVDTILTDEKRLASPASPAIPFSYALVCSSWYRLARQSRLSVLVRAGRLLDRHPFPIQVSAPAFPSLTTLHLQTRSLRRLDDAFLATLTSQCRRLTRLTIGRMSQGEVGEAGLAALANCTRLEKLRFLHGTSASSLPQSFQLPFLTHFTLVQCPNLASLPLNIAELLPSLRELELEGSTTLYALPLSLASLPSLRRLALRDLFRLAELPANLGQLPELRELELDWLVSLRRLPESLGQLSTLERLVVRRCYKLAHLPEGLGRLPLLKEVIVTK